MESAGQIPSPTTRIHVGVHVPTPNVTRAPPMPTPSITPNINCASIELDYNIPLAVVCGACFLISIFYCFFGYRFLRASLFLTGFIFGSLVTYLICLEENLLPLEGKIGVSITAGILCGLITMLVQYVGLFMTGFHTGLLLAIAVLMVMEQFYHPSTKWISIGILFGSGLLFSLLSLYFQKGLVIVGTCMVGAAFMTGAVDYFVEMFIMVHYMWDRVKANRSANVCWFSWLILGLWPTAFIVGVVTQAKVTAKGHDHKNAIRSRRRRKFNLQRERDREEQQSATTTTSRHSHQAPSHSHFSTPVWLGTIHTKYRHLYKIRRVNGDVISQKYLQNIHQNLSPALQALTTPGTTEDEGGPTPAIEHVMRS